MNIDEAQIALLDHQSRPYDLWACIRAVRGLCDAGFEAEARAVATTFSERHGAGPRGGDALLTAVQQAEVRTYAPGDVLVQEGALDDGLFILLTGGARVLRVGVGELAHLPPGSVVGEVAAATGAARTATVQAEDEVASLYFETKGLAELCKTLPSVYVRLRETSRARMVAQLMGPGSIFGHLGDAARAALYEQCLPITLPVGAAVISHGQAGRGMCIIASGIAEVHQAGPDGADEVVARLGPGDVFGEMSLLYERVASADVRAATVLTVFALDRRRFDEALSRFPQARDRVRRLAQERLGLEPGDGAPAMPVVEIRRTPPPLPADA